MFQNQLNVQIFKDHLPQSYLTKALNTCWGGPASNPILDKGRAFSGGKSQLVHILGKPPPEQGALTCFLFRKAVQIILFPRAV